jgi:hypothetical protein
MAPELHAGGGYNEKVCELSFGGNIYIVMLEGRPVPRCVLNRF